MYIHCKVSLMISEKVFLKLCGRVEGWELRGRRRVSYGLCFFVIYTYEPFE